MRNAILALNLLLLAAVGFLYYKVFSSKTSVASKTSVSTASSSNSSVNNAQTIAYVDLDSLNEHIDYIKSKRKILEAEQKAIETDWQNGMRGLERQRDNFLKKGNAITQAEAEQFQMQLMSQQESIENQKNTASQKLADKSVKFMDDIQSNLKSFLVDYNKEKGYTYILTTGTGLDYMVYKDSALNITQDVVAGMNEKMKGK